MLDHDLNNLGQLPNDDHSIDELIRSTRDEIARCDELMGEKKPDEPPRFQPELPREYAELKLENEPTASETDEEPPAVSPATKTFIYVAGVLLLSMLLAFFAWKCADDVCALTRQDTPVTVTVAEDDSVADVASTLKNAGLIRDKWLFKLYCAVSHASRKIVPGTYELNAVFDYHALVSGMAASGKRATISVTVPEGYECADIFALLEEKGVCSAQALYDAAANGTFDYAFLPAASAGDQNRLEGCLFPDTYEFYVDDDPLKVLEKFLRNTDTRLSAEMWDQLDALNRVLAEKKSEGGFSQAEIEEEKLSMHDILTVASLIEKEAAGSPECATIASVIYNRLCSKAYPCLNIDATIQYALAERKEQLSEADKMIQSPYNTYTNAGLPAGPIASPGMSAIRGALNPETTDFFFYALNKEGKHTFTKTYDEHLSFLEGPDSAQ